MSPLRRNLRRLARPQSGAAAEAFVDRSVPMLCDCHVSATIPAKDMARARQFYEKTLGFDPVDENPGGVMYHARGSAFFLYPSEFAGTNKATVMGFETNDLRRQVNELRLKGVKFEEYTTPGVKTVDGIAEMGDGSAGAWFTDTEGNILSLIQPVRSMPWPRDEVTARQGA
jgi:catechol 2,3-dioxygenase-like lactoylglutathione lyase family enzyme